MRKSTIILLAILVIALIVGIVFAVKWFVDHPKYYITLDANGGSLNSDIVEVRYGREYILPIPARKDYDFYGWYLDGVKVDTLGKSWEIEGDVTLVAKWKITDENKLTYLDANGGLAVSDYFGNSLENIIIPAKFASKKIVSLGGNFENLKKNLAAANVQCVTFYVPTGCQIGDLSHLGVKCEIVSYDLMEDNFFYINKGEYYSVSGYVGEPAASLTVPSEVADKPVSSIENGAFNSLARKYATSSIAYMEVYISQPCTYSQSVFDFEKPLLNIDYSFKDGDFYYLDKGEYYSISGYAGEPASSLTVPNEVADKPVSAIENGAFNSLARKYASSSVKYMKVYISYPCTYSQSVFDFEKPLLNIDYSFKDGDFYYVDRGNHIAITDYIGKYSSNIVVPESYEGKPILEIGKYAFYGATDRIDHSSSSFATLLLPQYIHTIGKGAFGNCDGLKVSLYTRNLEDKIVEIIDVPTLYEWYVTSEIGYNPQLLDVITQIRPAFGWSSYTNVSYYVKLNVNGGSFVDNDSTSIFVKFKRNKEYSLPVPEREGYTFAGWYYGDTLVANEGERWLYSTHIELTAAWTQN